MKGIDVSTVQGPLDFSKVAADFVYHRCGVGNDKDRRGLPVRDGCFRRCIDSARAAGKLVGAYHFLYPLPIAAGHEDRDPKIQAQRHFDMSGGLGCEEGDLPPMVDLEWPAPQDWAKWGCTAESIKDSAQAYLEESDDLHGKPLLTGIYIYPDFAWHLGDMSRFEGRPLWWANYGGTLLTPPPWATYDIRQDSGGGGRLYTGAPVDTDIASDDTIARLLKR